MRVAIVAIDANKRIAEIMADEEKDKAEKEQTSAESTAPVAKPKSDMMMYIIVGVGALVVTMGVMLGLVSGGHAPMAENADGDVSEGVAEHEAESAEEPETPDIFSELDDLSFLADTNFGELSGSPEERLVAGKSKKPGHSKAGKTKKGHAVAASQLGADDSLAALNWLEAEKKKLKERNKTLDEKAKRLEALERSVNQKLTKVDQAEAARLSGLAKLYNGMKPEQVAKMMVKLDDKTIVAILPRMKSAQAAKILGMLPASRGARISKEMITLSAK